MGSGGEIPSSSFERGHTPYTQNMMHLVVRDMGNGVERLEWLAYEPRPSGFPFGSDPIDPRSPAVWELLEIAIRRAGIDLAPDALLVGFRYDHEGLTHLCIWSCINPFAAGVAPVLRLVA